MNWLSLTYALPSKASSSPRVTLWRRLRRLGAIAVAGGPQVLPARDDCEEAFGWLAQEIHDAGGEAVVMHVHHFAGLTDAQLIDRFQTARTADYDELGKEVALLERASKSRDRAGVRDGLEKAHKRLAEIAQVDYFACPAGARLADRLARVRHTLEPAPAQADMADANVSDYRGKLWVTRPRPYVDRLACAWFIRKFVDAAAVIRYAGSSSSDEIAFDMEQGHFGHRGNLCTFEVMSRAFGVDDPGLHAIAEIVHEIDLHDGRYAPLELAGVKAILDGWHRSSLSDAELESHGIGLFEGLFVGLSGRSRSGRDADQLRSGISRGSGRRARSGSYTP